MRHLIALLAVLHIASTAAAQITPSEALGVVEAYMASANLSLRYERVDQDGAVHLTGVVLDGAPDPVNVDWASLTAQGDGTVLLAWAPIVKIQPAPRSGHWPGQFEFTRATVVISGTASQPHIRFDSVDAALVAAHTPQEPDIPLLRFDAIGLAFSLNGVDQSASISFDQLFTTQPDDVATNRGFPGIALLTLRAGPTDIDVQGFLMPRIVQVVTQNVVFIGEVSPFGILSTNADQITFTVDLSDDAPRYAVQASNWAITRDLNDTPATVSGDALTLDPVPQSGTDMRSFRGHIALRNLVFDRGYWARFDPFGGFPVAPLNLELNVTGAATHPTEHLLDAHIDYGIYALNIAGNIILADNSPIAGTVLGDAHNLASLANTMAIGLAVHPQYSMGLMQMLAMITPASADRDNFEFSIEFQPDGVQVINGIPR